MDKIPRQKEGPDNRYQGWDRLRRVIIHWWPGLGETKKFREVLEYAQLESGHWYPRKILLKTTYQEPDGRVFEGKGGFITVYVDTEREIPEEVFSPDYLPEQQNHAE